MWSDRETSQDCLGFNANVEVLAQCCIDRDLSPLTLGVFGLWGSGKTSLMMMIRSHIDAKADPDRVLTLWFNAWRYEGRDEAQSALIHAIIARLSEKQSLSGELKNLADKVIKGASVMKLGKFITKSAITMTPDISGFLDCFSNESQKLAETMEGFEKDFEALLEQTNVDSVVVFIDDLDRCSSEKVVETLETIKLFLNTPRCTFVLGADAQRIEEAVGNVFGVNEQQTRRDYLEKIVHLPFLIPDQSLRDIECYVGMLVLRQYLSEELWTELLTSRAELHKAPIPLLDALKAWATERRTRFDRPGLFDGAVQHLERLIPQTPTLARGLRGNPRQIKRFLNILALRERIASANDLTVDHALLTKFAVLEYTWKDFLSSLVESVDPENGRSAFLTELLEKSVDDLKATEDSLLLSETAKQPGLVAFLKDEPVLPPHLDLRPYLFLAQTSLGTPSHTSLTSVDELVTDLVQRIASTDRVRSRAAARQAAAKDVAIVDDIVRVLLTELVAKEDAATRTHIMVGLDEICRSNRAHYAAAVDGLTKLTGSVNDAVSVAATTLLNNAASYTDVPDELKNRYETTIAKALGGRRSAKTPRKA